VINHSVLAEHHLSIENVS